MDLVGSRIGDVSIDGVIGEGGMGTIYAGFDDRLQREVAVKVVRSDRLDADSRARLLREARMLSRLDHAHVCRLYGYVEGDGSDLLVLERLRGTTLKETLKGGRPFDRATRLRLAAEIAETLRVAHARGIMHRDLSPANVMLVGDAEAPSVKVLDFGLAKPVGDDTAPAVTGRAPISETSADSVFTELGKITGTPGTLSPEQARGEALTPASDIFSFGLLLQHLLTGEPAIEPGLNPRQKVARAFKGETLPPFGLDGETTRLLESMLAFEPENRPSAAKVVTSLARIRERPRRLARRATAAALAVLALAAGAKYFVDLRAERNLALAARAEAVEARARAEQARAESEEVSEFLVGVFGASTPGSVDPELITARQILDQGAERIDDELAEQPLVQARLQDAIGRVYLGLGLYPSAGELQAKALETRRRLLPSGHADLAVSLLRSAEVAIRQGRFDEARAWSEEALAIAEDHGEVPIDIQSGIVSAFGLLSMQNGELDRARELFEGFLPEAEAAFGERSLAVSNILNNLAVIHLQKDEVQSAEPLLERVVEIRREELGERHVNVARAMGNLVFAYSHNRGPSEALPLARQVLETLEEVQGPDHPNVAQACENSASLLLELGRIDEARQLHERSLDIRRRALGERHPLIAQSIHNLGQLALAQRDLGNALPLLEEALERKQDLLGPEHPSVLETRYWLAVARRRAGETEAAQRSLEELVQALGAAPGEQDRAIRRARRELARTLLDAGRDGEASVLLESQLAADSRRYEAEKSRTAALELAATLWLRSRARGSSGDAAQAAPGRDDLQRMAEVLGSFARPGDAESLEALARAQLALGRGEAARPSLDALASLDYPVELLAPELFAMLPASQSDAGR